MLQPAYASVPPSVPYGAPTFARPNNRPPAVSAPRAAAPARPRQLVRAKGPDEPTPPRPPLLTMPSPEQLGVTVRSSPVGLDGSALHTRIQELGIISYHVEPLTDGRCRFTCWVPRGQPGVNRRIEIVAATEAEAVRLGLDQAGQSWTTP